MKAMVMVTGEHTRGYWEEKILGLGSPKIDKVMATRKEDVEVPEAWQKVIEKEDGICTSQLPVRALHHYVKISHQAFPPNHSVSELMGCVTIMKCSH